MSSYYDFIQNLILYLTNGQYFYDSFWILALMASFMLVSVLPYFVIYILFGKYYLDSLYRKSFLFIGSLIAWVMIVAIFLYIPIMSGYNKFQECELKPTIIIDPTTNEEFMDNLRYCRYRNNMNAFEDFGEWEYISPEYNN